MDSMKKKLVCLLFCLTEVMVVDVLTKALLAYKLTAIKGLLKTNDMDLSIVNRKGVETGWSSSSSGRHHNSKE